MGQFTSPQLENYLKTLIPMMPSQRLPFFNRMDNLCELSGVKMPDALKVEVQKLFGFEMVKIIEGFADYSAPRLKEILYGSIGNVIPRPLQLEFIRLFSRVCSSCEVICLTVSDPTELPDPPEGCEFALLFIQDQAAIIYEWDGAAWNPIVGVATGDYTEVEIATTDAWTVTINGVSGLTSADSPYTIPAPTGYVDATFVNGACSYVMERIEPPIPLMTWLFVDINNVPFDPNDPANWNQGITGIQPTSVIVTGNQVEVFGYLTGDTGTIGDAGLTAFSTNLLFVTDNAGFIVEVLDLAFSASTSLLGVNFPACEIVGIGAFGSCSSFGGLGSAILTTIGSQAFIGTQMSEGTHLLCTSLGAQSFSGTGCATLNFPLLETIEVSAFDSMPNLTDADFPACLDIRGGAFAFCSLLDTTNFPLVVTVASLVFQSTAITSISLPSCTTFEDNGMGLAGQFANCLSLVSLNAPLLTAMGSPNDDDVFLNISGNTITITVSSVLATINGGNPDGDIDYLDTNNTLTVNYV